MGREVDSPRTIPGGAAVPDGTIAQIFKKTDLVTPVASVAVSGGKYDHSYDGSYGPIETRVTYGGETRIRDSWSIGQAGPVMMSDLASVLQVLGHGVINAVGHKLQVTAGGAGRTVLVRDGIGVAAGISYNQATDNKTSPTFATNTSGQPRIDLIGFQVWTPGHAQEGRAELTILQGTPAATPVAATPTQNPVSGTWFEPLAEITLANGYSTITSGNIKDVRRYLGAPGETMIGQPTVFTAVSGLNLDGIFTADHRNYRVDINIDAASVDGADLRLQLRSGGATVATLYDGTFTGRRNNATGINNDDNNAAFMTLWDNLDAVGVANISMMVWSPQRAAIPTSLSWTGVAMDSITDVNGFVGGGSQQTVAAHDGFRLTPSSGTITGEIRVYGRGA